MALAASPAGAILRAMKLLYLAKIADYTERRLRAVCAEVLGDARLGENLQVWEHAVQALIDREFVLEEETGEREEAAGPMRTRLTIRKEDYFDAVISDYPPPARPAARRRAFEALRATLARLADADGLCALGTMYGEVGDHRAAIALYDEALACDERTFKAWNNRGRSLHAMGEVDEALACAERALALEPDSAIARNNYAVMLDAVGRHQEARAAIAVALVRDPDNVVILVNRGALAFADGQLVRAQAYFATACALDPHNAAAWYDLGTALLALDLHARALQAFARALDLRPGYAHAEINAAVTLARMRQPQQALEHLEAVDLGPDDEALRRDLLLNRGTVLRALDRLQEARQCFEEARRILPDDIMVLAHLSGALIECGEPGEALVLARRVIERDPGFLQGWTNLCAAQLVLGLVDDALVSANCAVVVAPSSPHAWAAKYHCHLARYRNPRAANARYKAHEADEALAAIERAVALAPDDAVNVARRDELRRARERDTQG